MSKLSSLLNELDQKGTNNISARIEATDPIAMGENTNVSPVPNIDKGVILQGGNQDSQVVDKTIKGEDLSGDELVKYMEETDKKGVITDSKIIENGITDDKGLDAINDYLIGLKRETEHAIETGELKPNQIRETGVVPEEVKEALGVDTNKLNKELQEAREINKPKEPKGKSTYNDLNSVEPINGGEREVVSSSTILPKATPVSTTPLEETKVTRIPLQNTFVADNKKETAKVENSLISNGCIIEGKVINSVLSRGTIVEKDVVLEECVILQDCHIKAGSHLKNVIVDKNNIIHENEKLSASEEYPLVIEKGMKWNTKEYKDLMDYIKNK